MRGGRDVQRRDVRTDGVDLVELGVAAGPTFPHTGCDDQAGTLQPSQELGCGRLGEAGQLTEPGARKGSVLQQQVEGGTVVHAPQQPWSSRPHRCLLIIRKLS